MGRRQEWLYRGCLEGPGRALNSAVGPQAAPPAPQSSGAVGNLPSQDADWIFPHRLIGQLRTVQLEDHRGHGNLPTWDSSRAMPAFLFPVHGEAMSIPMCHLSAVAPAFQTLAAGGASFLVF